MEVEKFIRWSGIVPTLKLLSEDTTCPIHIAAEIDQIIELAPIVDAVEVAHGRWMRGDEMLEYPRVPYVSDKHYCSECQNEANKKYDGSDYSEILSDYCPNCGAKMDGDGNA